MVPLFPRGPWACSWIRRPRVRRPWVRPWAAALLAASLPAWPLRGLAQQAGVPASTTPTLGQAIHPSNAAQMALVRQLRERGVVFYGAWWCPACFKQKNLFGQEAGNQLPYIECEKTDADRQRCDRAGIKAYPTWVTGNRRVEGVLSLEALSRWIGEPVSGPGSKGSRVPNGSKAKQTQ